MSSYATDYSSTKNFYEAAFGPLGYTLQTEFVASWDPEFPTRRACAFGAERPVFWVIETKQTISPRHIAFSAANRQAVADFYSQAIQNGGTDNGEPGIRAMYHEHYYGAFVLDPDGNNVEAVCHLPG